jgi:hypothetical protein
MITNFKIFENIKDIKPGEYIIYYNEGQHDLLQFLNNNIGQARNYGTDSSIQIEYINVPDNLKGYFTYSYGTYVRFLTTKNIIFHSPDKKDVEQFIAAKKYNI